MAFLAAVKAARLEAFAPFPISLNLIRGKRLQNPLWWPPPHPPFLSLFYYHPLRTLSKSSLEASSSSPFPFTFYRNPNYKPSEASLGVSSSVPIPSYLESNEKTFRNPLRRSPPPFLSFFDQARLRIRNTHTHSHSKRSNGVAPPT